MPLNRYFSYEHEANGFEPRAMTEAEFLTNEGRQIAESCGAWVWQWAGSRKEAIWQHVDKHAAWESDIARGLPGRATY